MAYLGENSLKKIFTLIKDYLDSKFGNVENKSSATIRSELTKENVTTALGYTPPTTNTTYGVATSSALGLIKSGTDITVDSSGNVSVNDDSHAHVISNVDGLQTALNAKAPLASPTLTGTPTAPTATAGTNTTQIATTAFVQTAVANLVDSAPDTLNTLGELAIAIEEHQDVTDALDSAITNKVDKVDGKGLSTNDYTTAEKTKLSGIATGAEVNQNAFSKVVVDSTTITADSKTDSLTLVAGTNVTLTPDATNDKVTIAATDTVYTHPSYTARTGVPTANATPAFGGTFKVSQPVSDATGHITAVNSRTITIPSTTASSSANGLMSSTDKTKLDATNIAYGTCTTAAATAAKVITISGNTNWTLTAGSMITVKFSYTNSASNPTFNVNGTGAKSVWYNTALITTSNKGYAGTANRPMNFVYDGTQYVFIGWSSDSNTTYSQATLGQGYGTCETAEATVAKVVTLSSYALATGGVVAVKFTYAVPANATMNINNKGAKNIFYRGSAITAGVIKAGDIGVFIYDGTQYHLLTVDRDEDTVYTLPTASSDILGGVKTTSTVTSTSGLTACPIISGVPYYKDTTYSLSSFGVTATKEELNTLDGITATVTELNYLDGVTSAIQTQLNNKVTTGSDASLNAIFLNDDLIIYKNIDENDIWFRYKTSADATDYSYTSVNTLVNDNHYERQIQPSNIELTPGASAGHGGFIDFHFNNSTEDYTARIAEYVSGELTISASNGIVFSNSVVAGGNIHPALSNSFSLGYSVLPWAQANAKVFNLFDGTNTNNYGSFQVTTNGTTSTKGEAYLMVGNGVASGTVGNAQGLIRIYGTGTGYTNIASKNTGATSYSVELPAASGNLGVMSLSGTTLTITI